MPSWFKKVFSGDAAKPKAIIAPENGGATATLIKEPPSIQRPALGIPREPMDSGMPKIRKVVEAPILVDEDQQSSWSDEIKIKARIEKDRSSALFLVDRPVLAGLSVWLPGPEWAEEVSPLADRLFHIKGVGSVLIHDTTVTIGVVPGRPWEELAADVGKLLREYLASDQPVVSKAFEQSLPAEDEIRNRLQQCVDLEINPGIAAHSGVISLERVKGNTVWITMGGGCQGCAASSITLRQGIHTAFRQTVPQIGAIYDDTDHAAGENPFYRQLPVGMA